MQHKILLVEDDTSISEMVKNQFIKEGFIVITAFDGEQAIELFAREAFDLILLDLMLPKLDGMEFLKIVREKSLIPILIMSAKDGDVDKALGLGFGADDYIAKPFSMIELIARVKAAIRRATHYSRTEQKEESKAVHIGELTIDPDNFSIHKNGNEIKLTSKEFHILKRMGSIIEYPVFYDRLTARENLDLHCEYVGYYDKKAIDAALDLVQLK